MNATVLHEIEAERAERWPNVHPEDYCHRCGEPNIVWFASSPVWNALMRGGNGDGYGVYDEPFNGIICPVCFGQMWELAFDARRVWELRMETFS